MTLDYHNKFVNRLISGVPEQMKSPNALSSAVFGSKPLILRHIIQGDHWITIYFIALIAV
jgi:hypothetical protein